MNIQVDPTRSNLASAMLNSKIRPRAVVGYGVKIFHPSPPNYVTRSPGTCKLTKLCKSRGRGKFVNTERSCQEKCSKIVKLVTNYKAILVRFLHRSNRFFTSLKHRFTQRSDLYNFCPNENKSFHRISTVSKHRSYTNNRGSEIKKWKVRTKPSKTTVTSQIGSTKIVYKSLLHRMTLFKFNLCRNIEKNPGPGARRHFMN